MAAGGTEGTKRSGKREAVDPIPRIRIHEEVAECLRERIRRGQLKPGDTLPSERELMAHFGVGRPAARDALLALHKDGLVEVRNGRRARILAGAVAAERDVPTAVPTGTGAEGGGGHPSRRED